MAVLKPRGKELIILTVTPHIHFFMIVKHKFIYLDREFITLNMNGK